MSVWENLHVAIMGVERTAVGDTRPEWVWRIYISYDVLKRELPVFDRDIYEAFADYFSSLNIGATLKNLNWAAEVDGRLSLKADVAVLFTKKEGFFTEGGLRKDLPKVLDTIHGKKEKQPKKKPKEKPKEEELADVAPICLCVLCRKRRARVEGWVGVPSFEEALESAGAAEIIYCGGKEQNR